VTRALARIRGRRVARRVLNGTATKAERLAFWVMSGGTAHLR
jgi:hypothetical protein